MRILNKTKEVLVLRLPIVDGGARIEEVEHGKESDDFIGLEDGDDNGDGAAVIEVSIASRYF